MRLNWVRLSWWSGFCLTLKSTLDKSYLLERWNWVGQSYWEDLSCKSVCNADPSNGRCEGMKYPRKDNFLHFLEDFDMFADICILSALSKFLNWSFVFFLFLSLIKSPNIFWFWSIMAWFYDSKDIKRDWPQILHILFAEPPIRNFCQHCSFCLSGDFLENIWSISSYILQIFYCWQDIAGPNRNPFSWMDTVFPFDSILHINEYLRKPVPGRTTFCFSPTRPIHCYFLVKILWREISKKKNETIFLRNHFLKWNIKRI